MTEPTLPLAITVLVEDYRAARDVAIEAEAALLAARQASQVAYDAALALATAVLRTALSAAWQEAADAHAVAAARARTVCDALLALDAPT